MTVWWLGLRFLRDFQRQRELGRGRVSEEEGDMGTTPSFLSLRGWRAGGGTAPVIPCFLAEERRRIKEKGFLHITPWTFE